MIYALTLWTDNYKPLYDKWLSSLPLGFEPITKHMDVSGYKTFGFRKPSWYECIKQKIGFFVETLNSMEDGCIVLCCDSDIMFLGKGDKLHTVTQQTFAQNPDLDMWIMRENTGDDVNGGFYFVKNSGKVRDYLKDAMRSCDDRLPFADQTFLNTTIKQRMNYQYIPNEYVVCGGYIHTPKDALFHHAVGCADVPQKLEQQLIVMANLNLDLNMTKHLVYFVVGGEPGYLNLLRFCMQSVRKFPENDQYDMMVMCDAEYAKHLEGADLPHADLHITPHNKDCIWASMRKTEIFQYKRIRDYDKVLFLDSDIHVNSPLGPVFDVIQSGDKLYTAEQGGFAGHTEHYFSRGDRKYTSDELAHFRANGIKTFNAGQFGFKVTDTMRDHFENVAREKECHDKALHCFEQSFMNDYFNRVAATDMSMTQHVEFFAQRNLHGAKDKILAHFCDAGIHWTEKLRFMRSLYDIVWNAKTE